MAIDDEGPYEVGYKKPPRNTRFRKGRSGNPDGRPKGSPNLATALERALNEKVVANEGGRRRTITKLEAAAKQLVNKAAAGDARSMQLLAGLLRETDSPAVETLTDLIEESDVAVMQSAIQRIRGQKPGGSNDGT